jgi:hypothetical protein
MVFSVCTYTKEGNLEDDKICIFTNLAVSEYYIYSFRYSTLDSRFF